MIDLLTSAITFLALLPFCGAASALVWATGLAFGGMADPDDDEDGDDEEDAAPSASRDVGGAEEAGH